MANQRKLEFENKALKSLLEKGYFNMEYNSTDCDGVSSTGIYRYESLEAFYEAEENMIDGADGPFSYTFTEEEERRTESYGHGWDIN